MLGGGAAAVKKKSRQKKSQGILNPKASKSSTTTTNTASKFIPFQWKRKNRKKSTGPNKKDGEKRKKKSATGQNAPIVDPNDIPLPPGVGSPVFQPKMSGTSPIDPFPQHRSPKSGQYAIAPDKKAPSDEKNERKSVPKGKRPATPSPLEKAPEPRAKLEPAPRYDSTQEGSEKEPNDSAPKKTKKKGTVEVKKPDSVEELVKEDKRDEAKKDEKGNTDQKLADSKVLEGTPPRGEKAIGSKEKRERKENLKEEKKKAKEQRKKERDQKRWERQEKRRKKKEKREKEEKEKNEKDKGNEKSESPTQPPSSVHTDPTIPSDPIDNAESKVSMTGLNKVQTTTPSTSTGSTTSESESEAAKAKLKQEQTEEEKEEAAIRDISMRNQERRSKWARKVLSDDKLLQKLTVVLGKENNERIQRMIAASAPIGVEELALADRAVALCVDHIMENETFGSADELFQKRQKYIEKLFESIFVYKTAVPMMWRITDQNNGGIVKNTFRKVYSFLWPVTSRLVYCVRSVWELGLYLYSCFAVFLLYVVWLMEDHTGLHKNFDEAFEMYDVVYQPHQCSKQCVGNAVTHAVTDRFPPGVTYAVTDRIPSGVKLTDTDTVTPPLTSSGAISTNTVTHAVTDKVTSDVTVTDTDLVTPPSGVRSPVFCGEEKNGYGPKAVESPSEVALDVITKTSTAHPRRRPSMFRFAPDPRMCPDADTLSNYG